MQFVPDVDEPFSCLADLLEKRLRKEKKARRQLRDEMVNCKPGSPASSGHNGRSSVPAPEMGLDLALKPSSSPGDPTRTQTTGNNNNNDNRELVERFQKLEALYN